LSVFKRILVCPHFSGRLKGRAVCKKCGRKFKLGEWVWSKKNKKTAYYCDKCYRKLRN